LKEVSSDLVELAREPKRLALIVMGAAGTTLGAALALWASVQAFGGGATFVTCTVVTMVGGTLASAAPTPGAGGPAGAPLMATVAVADPPAPNCPETGAAVIPVSVDKPVIEYPPALSVI